MKRIFSFLIVIGLLLSSSYAVGGDPNIEGGGGGMGDGTGQSYWNPGADGVRVSVMRGTTALVTFDLSNVNRSGTQRSFVIHDKLFYKRGGRLTGSSNYINWVPAPDIRLPTIISMDGRNNIATIRSYFTDRKVVEFIAETAGMEYDDLVSGDYKLLLEPIAYFKYNGVWYAMTATEAALFDVQKSGDLRYQMGALTHQNLAFAMFLERADLGIQPWTGATAGQRTPNIDILNYLGCGIVSFTPEDIAPAAPIQGGDYVYRTDTDVITSVLVPNTTGADLTPTTQADGSVGYAVFQINGTTYSKQIVCPAGSSQLVWVRWHTPSTPQDLVITVTPPGGGSIQITASTVALEENPPPDPEYDGPGQGPGITGTQYRPNFRPVAAPSWGSQTAASWDQWIASLETRWEPNVVWVEDETHPDGGEWVDQGEWVDYWDFAVASYSASLSASYKLIPDNRVPTATRSGSKYTMKSGYGVDASCTVQVSAAGGAASYDVTPVQHVVAVFPEFDYTTYDRFLTPQRNAYRTTWEFKSNPYSYYGERVHFTPLWYPDGDYTVPVAVFDVWTPGGMLYTSLSDSVGISGDMYDDWYIHSYVTGG